MALELDHRTILAIQEVFENKQCCECDYKAQRIWGGRYYCADCREKYRDREVKQSPLVITEKRCYA